MSVNKLSIFRPIKLYYRARDSPQVRFLVIYSRNGPIKGEAKKKDFCMR